MKPFATLARSMTDMRNLFALTLLALLLGGCASSRPAPAPALPFITLEKEPAGEHWRATWHLDAPARELRFERNDSPFRGGLFEVLTPGFTIQHDGELEVLRTEGEPVRSVTVRFPEFTRALEKEYNFFQKFSDGSVAIYTGHLVAQPAQCDDCFIRTFRFIGPPATAMVVGGRVVASPFEWRDEQRQGSYIYFGNIAPVESAELITIIDPAVPDWLEEETKRALPRLFALYTERFGVDLPTRPTILFNYVDNGHSGYSNQGGTLPGQVQLTLDGAAWAERSDSALLHLFHFLAHESVHLWNGQVIHYPGTEDSWMHEGSADALAQRTLLELGLVDEAAFLAYQSSALNECRKGLGGFPLRDAAKRGNFSLYYSCGNMLALLTESSTADRRLFHFWKDLIERTRASGEYAAEDYFAVWRASGADADDVEAVRAFVERSAGANDLAAMLAANGVATIEEANPPDGYGQSVARDTLLAILKEQCRSGYSFNASTSGLALAKLKDCGAVPSPGIVTAIGGHDVLREGERTWDALYERCGTGGSVSLRIMRDGAEQTVDVPCTKPVPARPPYLRIDRRAD